MGILVFFALLALSAMAGSASRADFSIITIKDLREDDAIMELYELWLAEHKKAYNGLTRSRIGSLYSKTIFCTFTNTTTGEISPTNWGSTSLQI